MEGDAENILLPTIARLIGRDLREYGVSLVNVGGTVKGTQGDDICFIITAAEVRNAMIDRKHLTCIVTAALTSAPRMFTYTREDFSKRLRLEPIAFRAQLLSA